MVPVGRGAVFNFVRICLYAALLTFGGGVFAQGLSSTVDNYFGLETGIGLVDTKKEFDETARILSDALSSDVTYSHNKSFLTGRVFFGYGLRDNLAIEIGAFTGRGLKANYKIVSTGDTAREEYDVNGFDVVGTYLFGENPYLDSGLYIKGGIHSSKVSGRGAVTLGGQSTAVSASTSGTGLVLGLGAHTPFDDSKNGFIIRFGYTHYRELGGISGGHMNNLSIGYIKPF